MYVLELSESSRSMLLASLSFPPSPLQSSLTFASFPLAFSRSFGCVLTAASSSSSSSSSPYPPFWPVRSSSSSSSSLFLSFHSNSPPSPWSCSFPSPNDQPPPPPPRRLGPYRLRRRLLRHALLPGERAPRRPLRRPALGGLLPRDSRRQQSTHDEPGGQVRDEAGRLGD
jgi:hypothetical protein